MHDVTEQIERLAMMMLLVLLGGALVDGLLAPLTWVDALAAVVILLVVRPALSVCSGCAPPGARGSPSPSSASGVSAHSTIWPTDSTTWRSRAERLWAIAGLVVLMSVLLHGLTVTPVMRMLDRLRGRDPDADDAIPPPGFQGPAA